MDKLKVAVIGTGGIAEKHLEVIDVFDDVDLVALCNRGNPRSSELAERFHIARTFTDYVQMLDEVQVDAVLVLVSVINTVEVAGECLRRGIPTLLEKPPGLSSVETEKLLSFANTTNCLNMVALNRRFYSVMQRAREAILEVGPLVSVGVEAPERLAEIQAFGAHPPEIIQGLLFANGIHCIDLLRYFGGDLVELHALSNTWLSDQKNSFAAVMRFQSGAMGHYVAHWPSPGRWSVNLYGNSCRVLLAPLEEATVIKPGGVERQLPVDEVDVSFKPGFYAQNRYFFDCVKNQKKPSYPAADLADTLKTMKLIEALGNGTSTN